MDSVEKNIKNVNEVVKYSKNVDLRQITETLQVKVYATGLQFGKKLNKTLYITMDYDVSKPVQLYITLSLKQVGVGMDKSLLSTKEIFSPGKEAALRSFSPPKNGKNHQIEMLLPNMKIDKNYNTLGFDVDLRLFSTTGPVTSTFFKLNLPRPKRNIVKKYFRDKTGNIDKVTLLEPKRIRTLRKAPTSYVKMTTKDLELGQVKFNYFEYFNSLNQKIYRLLSKIFRSFYCEKHRRL